MLYIRVLAVVAACLTGIQIAAAQTAPPQEQASPPAQQQTPQQAQPPAAAQPPAQKAPPAAPPAVVDVDPKTKERLSRVSEDIEGAEKEIDSIEKSTTTNDQKDQFLGNLRGRVEAIMYESTQLAEDLRPKLAETKGLIEKLGPPPKPEGPAEAAPVAAERTRLNALASAVDGGIKTSELTWVRARRLIERITNLRHDLFALSITQKLPSPFSLALWREVWTDAGSVVNTLSYVGASWIEEARPKSATVLAIVVVAGILYVVLRRAFRVFSTARMRRRDPPPAFFERAMAATWYAPLRAIAPIFATLLLYVGLESLDILHYGADKVLWAIVKGILIYSTIAAVVSTVMAPNEPDWRLVPLAGRSARQISGVLLGIAAVYAIDIALTDISRTLYMRVSVTVVETLVANMALAGLFICVLMTPFTLRDTNGAAVHRLYPVWFKGPIWLVVIGIIAATFLGYVALGRFMAHQLVLTGVVVVVTGLLYLAIRALTREPQEINLPVTEILESKFGLDAPRRQTLARLTELMLSLLLVMLAVPFILLQWGFSGADIRDWFKSMFFGFEIGTFRISLAKIVLGIGLFIALVLVTRLFQRWLRDMMLTPARMDAGIAHSIETVVGYIGTALAGLAAISYAGFDITNLAIVAGALSVGIGFGLQSIVNNFVSGLILLFERPVKVGDWIVVGGDEGIVRRISVRSTEIETFDRSSVVLPNSELIMGRVKNWTLRDAMGRTKITFTVRYDMDPAKARDIALEMAGKHPDVLKSPPPFVSFDAFSGDSAQLSLNFFVGDVTRGGRTKSQLSFNLLKALPDAGIALMPPMTPPPGPSVSGPVAVSIPVTLAPDGDPDKLRRVLEETARTVTGIESDPAPVVKFESFDADGMKLSLTAHAGETATSDQVRTDLAFAVHRAMREAGIETSGHRHSVKLTDLEPIRQAVFAAMEERRRNMATEGGGS
jgi:small-conductance mechanosensitive channel